MSKGQILRAKGEQSGSVLFYCHRHTLLACKEFPWAQGGWDEGSLQPLLGTAGSGTALHVPHEGAWLPEDAILLEEGSARGCLLSERARVTDRAHHFAAVQLC